MTAPRSAVGRLLVILEALWTWRSCDGRCCRRSALARDRLDELGPGSEVDRRTVAGPDGDSGVPCCPRTMRAAARVNRAGASRRAGAIDELRSHRPVIGLLRALAGALHTPGHVRPGSRRSSPRSNGQEKILTGPSL